MTDPEAQVRVSPGSPADYNPMGQDGIEDFQFGERYFEEARDGTVVTSFSGFKGSDHYHSLLMMHLKNETGTTAALFIAELEIGHMLEVLNENFQLGETGEIDLATPDGRKVVKLRESEIEPLNLKMKATTNQVGLGNGQYRGMKRRSGEVD